MKTKSILLKLSQEEFQEIMLAFKLESLKNENLFSRSAFIRKLITNAIKNLNNKGTWLSIL